MCSCHSILECCVMFSGCFQVEYGIVCFIIIIIWSEHHANNAKVMNSSLIQASK